MNTQEKIKEIELEIYSIRQCYGKDLEALYNCETRVKNIITNNLRELEIVLKTLKSCEEEQKEKVEKLKSYFEDLTMYKGKKIKEVINHFFLENQEPKKAEEKKE